MRTLQDESSWRARVIRFWQCTYAADYLGFAILLTAYLLIQFLVEPFHRMFSLDDRSKSYPHVNIQRVSSLQNILYAGVGPLTILTLYHILLPSSSSSRSPSLTLHKLNTTLLGLFTSLILTSLITDIVKNAVGRPRPDLIARCKPQPGTPTHELVTIQVCTETNHHTLHDGWRSFPSGHSSWAFAGLGYLSLFLAGQMHVFRPRTDFARVMVCFVPLVGAGLIAMSRLADYRHDVFDVSVGSALGMGVAVFSYRRHYRSLSSRRCAEPYENREEWGRLLQQAGMVRKGDAGGGGMGEDDLARRQRRSADKFTLDDSEDEGSKTMPLESIRQEEV